MGTILRFPVDRRLSDAERKVVHEHREWAWDADRPWTCRCTACGIARFHDEKQRRWLLENGNPIERLACLLDQRNVRSETLRYHAAGAVRHGLRLLEASLAALRAMEEAKLGEGFAPYDELNSARLGPGEVATRDVPDAS